MSFGASRLRGCRMSVLLTVSEKVAALRRAFDGARAVPFSLGSDQNAENLLAIRVSGDAYAIRVNEIAGLATGRKIVPIPSPIPELLGLAGIRGTLVPAYSLNALLGYGADAGEPPWLALCGAEESFALAFHEFEGYLRTSRKEVYPVEQKDAARMHVKEVIRVTGTVRPVVSVLLLRETIQERCRRHSVPKER
jgi:chemotaxis signal transduction protein